MVTDRLADAVNAAKSLLEAVGIPGQVIVDHKMGSLQIDAFTSRVSGYQDQNILVLGEGFLGLPAQSLGSYRHICLQSCHRVPNEVRILSVR